MRIQYRRAGGRRGPGEPGEDERLEIEDGGSFTLWRSTGTFSVGRFAGVLDEEVAEDIAIEARAAHEAGPFDGLPAPGASRETIEVDGVAASMGHPDEPDGPWGVLAGRVRELVDSLVDRPAAAIALDVSEDGRTASLVHRGSDPIGVDLTAVTVAAHLWKGYYEPAGSWERGPLDLAAADRSATPGWRHELPFDHGFRTGPGRSLQVTVGFTLQDGDRWVRASAARVPVIEPRARRRSR